MHARVAALLFGLAACACVTPDEGTMFTDFDPIPPGSSRLYVYDQEVEPSVHVSVNGHALSVLGAKEYATVALPPGSYSLGTDRSLLPDDFPTGVRGLEKEVSLGAGRATFCEYSVIRPYGLWEVLFPKHREPKLACSQDPTEHFALKECRRATALEDPLWQP